MINWRTSAIAAIAAVATAVVVLAPLGANAGTSPPSSPPSSGDGAAPPVTIAEQIVPGGGPVEIVHSWALAPTGSDDPTEAGNRPNLSYVADAGAVVEDSVTLYNYGNQQLTFHVYATDASNTDDGQFDLLAGTETPTDVGSWITVSQEYVTIPPAGQATLPITLTIPDDATPGDHTGAVLASNEAESTSPDGDVVKLDRRTGTRLFVRVNGPLVPELAVEDLSTSYDPAINPLAGSAHVTYTIANRGNVRLSGNSSIAVSGPFGLGEQQLPPTDFPELLPGGSITVTADVEDVPAFGVAVTKVRLEPDSIADAEIVMSSRRGLTFAPPIAVLLGLVAFGCTLVGLRAYRRHRSKQAGDGEHEADTGPHDEFEPSVAEPQRT